MRKIVVGFSAGLLCSIAVMVSGSQVDSNTMTTFGNTTILNADDLNNNNLALITAINDNAQRLQSLQTIDFHNYLLASNYTQKVFAVKDYTGAVSPCVLKRTYTRTQNGNAEDIKRVQERYDPNDANAACTVPANTHFFRSTPDAYYHTGYVFQTTDANGNPVTDTLQYLDPIPLFQTGIFVGGSFGGASVTSLSSTGFSSMGMDLRHILTKVASVTIVKTDNTTLTRDDCFTMESMNNANAVTVQWVCKDVGLVKRISSTGDVWELQSFN